MKRGALAVYREERFSPGKVEDDRAILDAVVERLRAAGLAVATIDGERLPESVDDPRIVIAMCQSADALARLDRFRCPVVNAPDAIRSAYRVNLLPRLDASGVPQPRWAFASRSMPAELGSGPWLKRGDVHAMEAADVRRIFDEAEWSEAVDALVRRGAPRAIAQAHREGVVYKFYGVAGRFFHAFGLDSEHRARAADLAARGARALGLDVYGGDGVVAADGSLALVDLNDWPSFSRCGDDAADAIAERVFEILERDASEPRTPRT